MDVRESDLIDEIVEEQKKIEVEREELHRKIREG